MEMRTLGERGPEISVLGFGGWEAGGDQWGRRPDADSIRAMHAAIEAGITWIDTAEVYGSGRSEELVAEVLRDRRDEVLVFTKVAHFASGLRPEQIRRAIRGSLKRLGTDHVDLYQIHWPAEHLVPIENAWSRMCEIADEGLALHVGVSNFDRALIERCLAPSPRPRLRERPGARRHAFGDRRPPRRVPRQAFGLRAAIAVAAVGYSVPFLYSIVSLLRRASRMAPSAVRE